MKTSVSFLFAIFITTSVNAQEITGALSATTFQEGYPSELTKIVQQLGMDSLKYASLETGLDSIEVFLGTAIQKNNKAYWAAISEDGTIKTMRGGFRLEHNDSTDLLTKIIDLENGESSEILKFYVQLDPTHNKLFYSWLNQNEYSQTASFQKVDRPIQKGKIMPDFSLETLEDTDITLSDLKGNYVVINWWSTFCGPCRAEIPSLNKVVEKYRGKHNIKFLAIAWNKESEVKKYLQQQNFKYQQALYTEELISIFGNSFPKHVVIDPKGYVTFYKKGGNTNTGNLIDKILHQQLN